jgi:hypothetical protein
MNKIKAIFTNTGSTVAYAIVSAIFAVVPEDVFKLGFIPCDGSWTEIIIYNRVIVSIVIFALANLFYLCYRKCRKSVSLEGKDFSISIEYADLLRIKKGKKVINFDECYSTNVGQNPGDIKPTSVCGQYLAQHPITDDEIQTLLFQAKIHPVGISLYGNKPKYQSGTIVPRNDFFLMAFAKLDENGLGRMTYEQYLDCLDTLWQQIDMHHGTDDVYLPILGSNITRFDKALSQQELLDVMIASYRLSPHKMKKRYKLHIVCIEMDGFSLNNVFGVD